MLSQVVARGKPLSGMAGMFSCILGGLFALSFLTEATLGAEFDVDAGKSVGVGQVKSLTSDQLALLIDRDFRNIWQKAKIEPARRTSDSEFARRVHLDLIGRIPSVGEMRTFLEDSRIDKRIRLVESLLQRGAYANHFANTWRDLLLGNANAEVRGQTSNLEMWLRLRFGANMPYDQLVAELLTDPLANNTVATSIEPNPLAFYQASEYKPELVAATVSRAFLGVQLQCAQCHDHPFTHWKQQQFWSFAAFFAGMQAENMMSNSANRAEAELGIKIPEKDITVYPVFLDGRSADKTTATGRQMLAKWIVARENPYFAKAVVNRLWDHFFGKGFVHPVDDLDSHNPPSHPELFEKIVDQFVLHNFDIKYLVQTIATTEAYQLSSEGGERSADSQQLLHFARMPLRRMTGDQLHASFIQATGYRDQSSSPATVLSASLQAFQAKFSDTSVARTEIETSILQALSQMNGIYTAAATDPEKSETLAAIISAPFLTPEKRIEMLYMSVLSRKPTEDESTSLLKYVDSKSQEEQAIAYADIFWALLNSAEFVLNH